MSNAPRGKNEQRVDAWPDLRRAIRHNRALRFNLLGAIAEATRAEWHKRDKIPHGGAPLVAEELKALEALEVQLRRTFTELDAARQRVGLWGAVVEAGDRRGWGRS